MNAARAIPRLAAGIGLAVALVLATPLTIWWSQSLAKPWQEASSGTLIVLAPPALASGLMNDSAYWRALYAVRAWRYGHFDRVIILGPTGASQMASLLRSHGLPHDRIFVHPMPSDDTHAAAVALLADAPRLPQPLALLTSDYHVARAVAAFRKAGLPVVSLPFPDGEKRAQPPTWYRRFTVFADLVNETYQALHYRYLGWL